MEKPKPNSAACAMSAACKSPCSHQATPRAKIQQIAAINAGSDRAHPRRNRGLAGLKGELGIKRFARFRRCRAGSSPPHPRPLVWLSRSEVTNSQARPTPAALAGDGEGLFADIAGPQFDGSFRRLFFPRGQGDGAGAGANIDDAQAAPVADFLGPSPPPARSRSAAPAPAGRH